MYNLKITQKDPQVGVVSFFGALGVVSHNTDIAKKIL